jgi:hypothetical protein
MTTKSTLSFLATGALLLSPTLARAGVTIVAQRGDGAPTTMLVEGERARVDLSKQDEHASGMILDGPAKRFLILNDKDKSYSEVTQEDMKRIRGKVDEMRKLQEERMKSLPPEQRKKMEEMMARMGAPGPKPKALDIKFERTGEKKTVNGFACETYRMLEDGKVVEEECVSPWSAGLVKKSDFEGLRKFAEQMADSFGGGGNDRDLFMMKKMDAFPGFPITRTKIDAAGKRTEMEQVKSVKRGALDGATFAVPAGYTKKPSPFEQMGGPGGPGMDGPGGAHHGGPPHP